MHYYKRNLGDYAKKAGRLSMLQHGAYTLLIDACYDREQFPTMADAIDWTWASSAAEVEAVEFVLRKFFTLEDGVYVQKRIQEEIEAYRLVAETNARIARERETKRAAKSTERVRSVDEATPVQHEAPPNHKPLTINQEPVTKEKKAPRERSAPVVEAPMATVAELVEAGFSEKVAAEFIAHKAKLKAPLTARAWRDHLAEATKAGWSALQAAEKVMAKNWKGFEAKYVAAEQFPATAARPLMSYRERDEMAARERAEEFTGRSTSRVIDVTATDITPALLERQL